MPHIERIFISIMLAAIIFATTITLFQADVQGAAATYYVSTSGSDTTGDGSNGNPWRSLTYAINNVPDNSLILVQPGTYVEQVQLDQQFTEGITVAAAIPYQARLRYSGGAVVRSYYGQNITLSGFDIAHLITNTGALVIQIQDLLGIVPGDDGGSDPVVEQIRLYNNIIHDSTNNDLLKINNGARNITVKGNMFFNQEGSDEHMDVNSVVGVTIEDNIFFNQFDNNLNNTSSYVVVKDSNGTDDTVLGAEDITIRRNIFLNWQGSTAHSFLRLGEDNQTYYEAFDILVENNLMIGNASDLMRTAFTVQNIRDVVFRHNTIVGDLPARSFAMRLISPGGPTPNNDAITFYNNIWSDPTGSMGSEAYFNVDFADAPIGDNISITLDNNLYWNGGSAIPADATQHVHYTDDVNRIVGDPVLPAQLGLVVPHWNGVTFADGSTTIREAFERLAALYGEPGAGSLALDAADSGQSPTTDILGNVRYTNPDIGAVERCGYGTAVAVSLSISRTNQNTILSWPGQPANQAYEVHLANTPYFSLTASSYITTVAGVTTWHDNSGESSMNDYYRLLTTNCWGETEAMSNNEVSVFHYILTAGD